MVHRFLVDLASSGAILVAPVGAEEVPAQMCSINAGIDAPKGGAPIFIRACRQPSGHGGNIVYGSVRADMLENWKFKRTVTSKSPEEQPAPVWRCRAPLRHWAPIRGDQIVAMDAGNLQSHSDTLRDIGNEPGGDYQMGAMSIEQSEFEYDLFAKALRKGDPWIEPIAAGAMNVDDWPAFNSCNDTYPLDLSAAFGDDRKTSMFAVLNPSKSGQTMVCSTDRVKLASEGCLCQMATKSVDATVSVGLEPRVEVQR